MTLNQEERENFINWLNEKSQFEAEGCPVCGHNDWSVDRSALLKREGQEIDLDTGLHLIFTECNNCGHVLLFNEKLMNI